MIKIDHKKFIENDQSQISQAYKCQFCNSSQIVRKCSYCQLEIISILQTQEKQTEPNNFLTLSQKNCQNCKNFQSKIVCQTFQPIDSNVFKFICSDDECKGEFFILKQYLANKSGTSQCSQCKKQYYYQYFEEYQLFVYENVQQGRISNAFAQQLSKEFEDYVSDAIQSKIQIIEYNNQNEIISSKTLKRTNEKHFKKIYHSFPDNAPLLMRSINCPCCGHPVFFKQLSLTSNSIWQSQYKNILCEECGITFHFIKCYCEEIFYSIFDFSSMNTMLCSKKKCLLFKKCQCGTLFNPITRQQPKSISNNLNQSSSLSQDVILNKSSSQNIQSQSLSNINNPLILSILCYSCQETFHFMFCNNNNQEIIPLNKQQVLDNELISCPNEACKFKKFKLIRCPNLNCFCSNFFIDYQFSEVEILQCAQCKTCFQLVKCPECEDFLYFDSDFKINQFTQCPNCKLLFQIWQCTFCSKQNYKYGSQDQTQSFFSQEKCQKCSHITTTTYCQICDNNQTFLDLQFKFGFWIQCQSCKIQNTNVYYKFYKCNLCNQISYQSSQEATGNLGEVYCTNPQCNWQQQKEYMLFCHQCNENFVLPNLVKENEQVSCTQCRSNYEVVTCKNCKTMNSYSIEFNKCVECNKIILGTLTEAQKEGQCRSCFSKKAEYIFKECKHLCLCSECATTLNIQQCCICGKTGEKLKLYI